MGKCRDSTRDSSKEDEDKVRHFQEWKITDKGIIQAISQSTNTTVQTSGTVFSATILDGLMQNCWGVSNGDVATDIFVGGVMKRDIDAFTAKTNVVVNSPDIRGIVKTVTTYETSFGKFAELKLDHMLETPKACIPSPFVYTSCIYIGQEQCARYNNGQSAGKTMVVSRIDRW